MQWSLTKKLSEWLVANPLAWILFALLALAEYGNYHRGKELERICELLGEHDVYVSKPKTPREEIDKICISRQPD